jgi:hypothetical protein
MSLELAAVESEVIDFLSVYGPSVTKVLPDADAEKWRSFHHNIYTRSQMEG